MSLQIQQTFTECQVSCEEIKTNARSLPWSEGEKHKKDISILKCVVRAVLETQTWCSEKTQRKNFLEKMTTLDLPVSDYSDWECHAFSQLKDVISARNALTPITSLADLYSFLSMAYVTTLYHLPSTTPFIIFSQHFACVHHSIYPYI